MNTAASPPSPQANEATAAADTEPLADQLSTTISTQTTDAVAASSESLWQGELGWGNYYIDGIVELSLPAPVSLWPTTPGWGWLLAGITLYGLIKLMSALKRYWRNRYRRLAVARLIALKKQFEHGDQACLRQLPELLKACALQAYSRRQIAALQGPQWEAFLDSHYPGPAFAEHFPGLLAQLSYQPLAGVSEQLSDAFWRQIQCWLLQHQQVLPPVTLRSRAQLNEQAQKSQQGAAHA